MDKIAGQCNGSWQMVDGKVELVPDDTYITSAIVLKSNIDLINIQQQTLGQGISI